MTNLSAVGDSYGSELSFDFKLFDRFVECFKEKKKVAIEIEKDGKRKTLERSFEVR